MEFNQADILKFRKLMYNEIGNCIFGPEKKDFDKIKPKIIEMIAYRVWEIKGKPSNKDIEIWLEAEKVWDFIRYMW